MARSRRGKKQKQINEQDRLAKKKKIFLNVILKSQEGVILLLVRQK